MSYLNSPRKGCSRGMRMSLVEWGAAPFPSWDTTCVTFWCPVKCEAVAVHAKSILNQYLYSNRRSPGWTRRLPRLPSRTTQITSVQPWLQKESLLVPYHVVCLWRQQSASTYKYLISSLLFYKILMKNKRKLILNCYKKR